MADRELPTSPLKALWRRAVDANVVYGRAVGSLTTSHLAAVASVARGLTPARRPAAPARPLPVAPAPARAPRLVLEGTTGAAAVGAFVVENGLDRRVEASVAASRFEAEGAGSAAPPITFEPARIVLEPGEQTVVRALVRLDEMFAADRDYRGNFVVPGLPGTRVPVAIRRLGTADR
jgi:hypothetical protein